MKKNLVLISTSLILSGCAHHVPQGDEQVVAATPPPPASTGWWYFHHGTYVGSPSYGGGSGGGFTSTGVSGVRAGSVSSGISSGSFKASPSVSARGGFGSAGHAFGASS